MAGDNKGLDLVTMEVSPLLGFLKIFPCSFFMWSKQLRAQKKAGSGTSPVTAKSSEDNFSCSRGLLTFTATDCSSQGPLRLCWVFFSSLHKAHAALVSRFLTSSRHVVQP